MRRNARYEIMNGSLLFTKRFFGASSSRHTKHGNACEREILPVFRADAVAVLTERR